MLKMPTARVRTAHRPRLYLALGIVICTVGAMVWYWASRPTLQSTAEDLRRAILECDAKTIYAISNDNERAKLALSVEKIQALLDEYVKPVVSVARLESRKEMPISGQAAWAVTEKYRLPDGRLFVLEILVVPTLEGPRSSVLGALIMGAVAAKHYPRESMPEEDALRIAKYRGLLAEAPRLRELGFPGTVGDNYGSKLWLWEDAIALYGRHLARKGLATPPR